MTAEERVRDYIRSLEPDQDELCEEIARDAREKGIPIIKRETGALLKTMVAAKQPGAILEIGTAVGYSALMMARAAGEDCRITTIEKYKPRILAARDNFQRAGMTEKIVLLEGDAQELLENLSGTYDFIFMDAAKGQYIHWLPVILRLLSAGGILFSDNVLQEGSVVQSRYAVERRDRTIHSRMREYLYAIKHTKELETAIVPVGDGVALSVKKMLQERNGKAHEKDGTAASGRKLRGA